ncbi:hypothetical protein BKA93DRAFT_449499 [Sparassis latifolia]
MSFVSPFQRIDPGGLPRFAIFGAYSHYFPNVALHRYIMSSPSPMAQPLSGRCLTRMASRARTGAGAPSSGCELPRMRHGDSHRHGVRSHSQLDLDTGGISIISRALSRICYPGLEELPLPLVASAVALRDTGCLRSWHADILRCARDFVF